MSDLVQRLNEAHAFLLKLECGDPSDPSSAVALFAAAAREITDLEAELQLATDELMHRRAADAPIHAVWMSQVQASELESHAMGGTADD